MRDLSLDLIKLYKMKKYSLWNTVNILFNTNPEDPEKFKKVMLLSEMMVKNQLKSMATKHLLNSFPVIPTIRFSTI